MLLEPHHEREEAAENEDDFTIVIDPMDVVVQHNDNHSFIESQLDGYDYNDLPSVDLQLDSVVVLKPNHPENFDCSLSSSLSHHGEEGSRDDSKFLYYKVPYVASLEETSTLTKSESLTSISSNSSSTDRVNRRISIEGISVSRRSSISLPRRGMEFRVRSASNSSSLEYFDMESKQWISCDRTLSSGGLSGPSSSSEINTSLKVHFESEEIVSSNEKDVDLPLPKFTTVLKEIGIIWGTFLLVAVFILLAAVPICYIESKNERQVNGKITKWTYGNAIYFTITTVCTIGYGDMAPATEGGRIYVVFMCFFGMGVVAALLVLLGTSVMNAAQGIIILIVKGIREAIIWSCLRLSRDFERGHKLREKRVLKALVSRKAHIVFQVVAIIAYALASAFLFSIFEHWSYIDSFYFTFVTLATIGYGDYTPQTFGGRVFFCLFVLIGFGMLAILVGMIGKYAIEKMQERIEKIKMQSRVAFEMLEKLKNSGPLVIGPNGEEMRRSRLSLDLPRPRLSIDFPSMMKRSPSLALFDKVTGYS